MTGLDPDIRFDKHKAGIQSNRYVKDYGLRLLPDLYEAFNPMSYDEARDKKWRWESICAGPGSECGRLNPAAADRSGISLLQVPDDVVGFVQPLRSSAVISDP